MSRSFGGRTINGTTFVMLGGVHGVHRGRVLVGLRIASIMDRQGGQEMKVRVNQHRHCLAVSFFGVVTASNIKLLRRRYFRCPKNHVMTCN